MSVHFWWSSYILLSYWLIPQLLWNPFYGNLASGKKYQLYECEFERGRKFNWQHFACVQNGTNKLCHQYDFISVQLVSPLPIKQLSWISLNIRPIFFGMIWRIRSAHVPHNIRHFEWTNLFPIILIWLARRALELKWNCLRVHLFRWQWEASLSKHLPQPT